MSIINKKIKVNEVRDKFVNCFKDLNMLMNFLKKFKIIFKCENSPFIEKRGKADILIKSDDQIILLKLCVAKHMSLSAFKDPFYYSNYFITSSKTHIFNSIKKLYKGREYTYVLVMRERFIEDKNKRYSKNKRLQNFKMISWLGIKK